MEKLATGIDSKHPQQQGFTLIEVLIVAVIIAITLSFATLAVGDFGGARQIRVAAEQFEQDLHFAQQQAMLESKLFGIQFRRNNYQLVRYDSKHHWQTLPSNTPFRERRFPKHTVIQFEPHSTRKNGPEIILHPSGSITPFRLYLGSHKNPRQIQIHGSYDGRLEIQKHEKR